MTQRARVEVTGLDDGRVRLAIGGRRTTLGPAEAREVGWALLHATHGAVVDDAYRALMLERFRPSRGEG